MEAMKSLGKSTGSNEEEKGRANLGHWEPWEKKKTKKLQSWALCEAKSTKNHKKITARTSTSILANSQLS